MKGIIFTEFLDLVAAKWGDDVVDELLEGCELPSGGAYTAVGTYDHREIVDLVVALSARSGVPVPDLLRVYGAHLFGRLAYFYPGFIAEAPDALGFLEQVESYIHVEVLKLYPDAELPRFETRRLGPGRLEMVYRSSRHLEGVCHGLIEGCLTYFEKPGTVALDGVTDDGGIRFLVSIEG